GLTSLQDDLGRAKAKVEALSTEVQQLALRQYLHAGDQPLFLFDRDINRLARVKAILRYVTVGAADSLDQYRVARQDLEALQARTSKAVKQRRDAIGSLLAEQNAAVSELQRLV